MKHGPIALIDENVPVIVLAPHDDLFEKTLANVEEVMARGGRVVMISDAAGVARLADRLAFGIAVPSCDPFVAPLALRDPDPATGLPRRRPEGHRCRPAAKSRQERDGRIARLAAAPLSSRPISPGTPRAASMKRGQFSGCWALDLVKPSWPGRAHGCPVQVRIQVHRVFEIFAPPEAVMAGLFRPSTCPVRRREAWITGTSPAMTPRSTRR